MNRQIQKRTNLLVVLAVITLSHVACTISYAPPTAVPSIVTPPPAVPSLDNFRIALIAAVIDRDFQAMPALMSDSFTLAYWRSEGVSVTPIEAVNQLQRDLSAPEPVRFSNNINFGALLDGGDPLMMAGPDVRLVEALFSSGWGSNGAGEAILLIAQAENGNPYWYGTLYAFDGFDDRPVGGLPTPTQVPATTPLPTIFDVRPTDVQYIMAQTSINMRSGPGTAYPIIGSVAEGQIALVTGVLGDGSWWRVICPNDSIGNCFVSADPSLTQPTDVPGAPSTATPSPPINQTGEATIEGVEVQILESFPVQVRAVVRGQLPDACSFIESSSVVQESTTFRIRMTTARQANQRCAQALTPFEEVVPLDVSGLPAGEYDVRINNRIETFTLAVDN